MRTPTTGDCRRTPTRSRIASADDFVLTLWTADPALAALADAAGVDRVGVDLEREGKRERQAGLGTWISPHGLDDLRAVAGALEHARAFARVDPPGPATAGQVEAALAAGAEVVMLPMLRTSEEADRFVSTVGGRATPVLLVEQAEALDVIEDIVAVPGVDEIHIGINDLALSLGARNRWAVFAANAVVHASEVARAAGLRFGIGGIGRVEDRRPPVPSDLVYAEQARLGSRAALIARRFLPSSDLAGDVRRARERLAYWCRAPADERARAHERFLAAVSVADRW